MGRKVPQEVIREKLILDSETKNPVKEIVIEDDKVVILKENGERVEIPKNTIRAKHILMRIEHGISEITEAIYV
ncbi:MAG: hypothetical protein Q9N26_07330 [Aquificota bacterium]|nr:hypothetical protein [Aquificota bacterium]